MADVNNATEASAVAGKTQFDGWDEHGTPIVTQPKTEEPAASATPAKKAESEPKGESAAESETATEQETRERKPGEKKTAEERIKELVAEKRRLEADLERERSRKPEPTSDKKAEQPKQPQSYKEWRADFKPKQWLEQYAKEHPDADYDDAVAAMADFQADVRDQFRMVEQQRAEMSRHNAEMLKRTEERYPDAKEAIKPTLLKVVGLIGTPGEIVTQTLGESEVFSDLLYVLGPEIDSFIELAKTEPVKAQRKVFLLEQEIQKELAKPKGEAKSAESKAPDKKTDAKDEPPAKTRPRLPDTPAEIGGRGASPEDPAVAAARSGDYSAFEREQNRRHFVSR